VTLSRDGPGLDPAPLALLRDYAALLGAPVTEAEETITLDLPESEAGYFRGSRDSRPRSGHERAAWSTASLEARLAPELARQRAEAARALADELTRLGAPAGAARVVGAG
jgi:hypothetical protein